MNVDRIFVRLPIVALHLIATSLYGASYCDSQMLCSNPEVATHAMLDFYTLNILQMYVCVTYTVIALIRWKS